MADYHVDINGKVTKKKKNQSDYHVDINGKVTKFEKDDTEDRTWLQKGAFSDGYQFGDVSKTILGTAKDIRENLYTGVIGAAETGIDTGATLLGGAAGLLGNDTFKNKMQKFVEKDLIDERKVANVMDNLTGGIPAWISEILPGAGTKEASVLGEKTGGTLQSGGQLALTSVLQSVGVPWYVTTGVTSFGGQVEEAFRDGATYGQAGLSGLISAGAEILSEKLFGGIKFGGKTLDDSLVKPFVDKISNKAVKTLVNLGIDATGEGAEEVISSLISNLGTKLYKEESIKELLTSEEAMDEYIESFFGGMLLGGGLNVGRAGKSLATGRDYKTGLTENEQKVVDKEVKNRVADKETDGKKLTSKEKAAIEEQVKNDLAKGYISIDTIESALGGEAYESYKGVSEQEAALKKEIESLENLPKEKITVKQSERLTEARKQLSGLDTTYAKEQLGRKVAELAKSDRLSESYNEKARRSQTFTVDLTKYNEKQQETVKRAAESGILNNTNRTHEFVDMLAKISADKGVSFDFTNNQKLEKSGFALEGRTVNGFIKGGNISINIQSAKALNTVVGHEITHVLEGSELYGELQQAVKVYAESKGEYGKRLKELQKLYAGVEGVNIENELTADIIGDYLFTDSDFVNRLSTEKPGLFRKIYEEIKYLLKSAITGSKQERELEKVKRTFEKAYKESGKASATEYINFSFNEDATISYESLVSKHDMKVSTITTDLSDIDLKNRDGIAAEARKRLVKNGLQGEDGAIRIHNDDTGIDIVVGKPGLRHGLDRNYEYTALVSLNLEDYLKNAIKVNEALPDHNRKYESDIYLGYGETVNGEKVPAYFVVSKLTTGETELVEFGSLYSVRAKKIAEDSTNGSPDFQFRTSATISISDLLDIVNESYSDILPKTVADHYGKDRRKTKLGESVKFSLSEDSGALTKSQEQLIEKISNFSFMKNYGKDTYSIIATNRFGFDVYRNYDATKEELADKFGTEIAEHIASHKKDGKGYSLGEEFLTLPLKVDSEGRSLSKEQGNYFKFTKVVDDNGNLKVVYHGSPEDFNTFSLEYLGTNGTAEGYGFYFTDKKGIAQGYANGTEAQGHQGKNGKLFEVYLDIRKPLSDTKVTITRAQFRKFIRELNKQVGSDGEPLYLLSNYGDIAYEGLNNVINNIMEIEYDGNDNDVNMIHSVINSTGEMETVFNVLRKTTGHDGIIVNEATWGGDQTIYIAFHPEQIKNVDNLTPTTDPDIRKSLSADGEHQVRNGSFNVYGKDITLKQEVAPVQQSASASEDIGPIRKDIASVKQAAEKNMEDIGPVREDIVQKGVPNAEENAPAEQVYSPDELPVWDDVKKPETDTYTPEAESYPKKVTTVKERNAAKLQSLKVQLRNEQNLMEKSHASYNAEIRDLQSEYDSKKNKNTQAANELLDRIERRKNSRDNTDAYYEKRIKDIKTKIGKMNTKEFKIAEQRMSKQEEYQTTLGELMGDTSTWVDKKMGIYYKVNTLRRNLRDIVRDENGNRDIAKADAIYDELQGKYNHNEADLNREANTIKEKYAKLKITAEEDAYIQMLGEYRHNPDTTLSADVMKEYFEKHKGKIDTKKVDEIIASARQLYDELFRRVNATLEEQGMRPLEYREGYFPHFTDDKQSWLAKLLNWKTKKDAIPTDIAGLTETFKPVRSWQSFDKHRTGDSTDYSFKKGLDMYVQGALDWIYHIEDIQKRRAFENEIRYRHSDQGIKDKVEAIRNNTEYDASEVQDQIDLVYKEARNPLNNFISDFRTQTNTLAGKKSSMDRGTEEWTNRTFYSTMQNISNRVTANMVVGSFSSALTNFIPITQSWAQVSPFSSLRAMRDTIKSYIRKDSSVVDNSDFLTNRLRKSKNLYQSVWDKAIDKAGWMMEAIDNFTSQVVWRSKYLENMNFGMSENEAIKNADQFAENVMAGRSRGNNPTIFDAKNPFIKIATAFQLEVNNQYGYLFKDVPQDIKNEAKGNLLKSYAGVFIGAWLYNLAYSALTGRDAALDPIGIILDVLKDSGVGGDEEPEEPAEIVGNLTESVLEELPFVGGFLGGGRIPISSALPYKDSDGAAGALRDFSEDVQNWKDGGRENFLKEMSNPASYLLLPAGGGQIRKTIQGLGMFSDKHPIAGSYTNSGKLRFAVEDTPLSKLQAALFGQWSSKNAREYIEEGISPLGEKQTQELIDTGLPIADYWKYRDGQNKNGTTGEKIDYIANLDLPIVTKNILANNVSERKTPIDLTDYDKFADYEDFDDFVKNKEMYTFLRENGVSYAEYKTFDDSTKNVYKALRESPEKYQLSQVITEDITEYVRFKREINGISSDKDESGNTINNSKKRKVSRYIDGLDIDYGQKLILFRSLYDQDNSYNYEIVEYLNEREDISYLEMESILKTLGFMVLPDGRIQW